MNSSHEVIAIKLLPLLPSCWYAELLLRSQGLIGRIGPDPYTVIAQSFQLFEGLGLHLENALNDHFFFDFL